MLQIATGMYCRDVEIRANKHRGVFYTNGTMLRAEDFELPIGRFLFSNEIAPATTVTIETVERLEAVSPDGSSEMLISTGGQELLNDVATVFGFVMNVTCSRNIALVERLVPPVLTERPSTKASTVLRRTFDPGIYLQPADIDAAQIFVTNLLALTRTHFEAAMRSIRRVVDATYLVGDDPSLAYTFFVTSLESLAQISTTPEENRDWDTYDSSKRKIIDEAISDFEPEQQDRVRNAVLKADQLALSQRFRVFVLNHIDPSYFREEAAQATRPIARHDLDNALRVAYRLRSRNVHELEVLAPELRLLSDRSDTMRFEDRWILSLEGMNRLCRHVIRNFVKRSPKGVDPDFDYREALPGRATVRLAPQYWIWKPDSFSPSGAPDRLEGLIELLLPPLAGADENDIPDMRAVLEKVERFLRGEAKEETRRPMVAIYVLWHRFMAPEHHRPDAARVIDRYGLDLDAPSIESFAIRILTGEDVDWADDELGALVEKRRRELARGRGQPLPTKFDAALLLCMADRLWEQQQQEAISLIGHAVETVPGNEDLMELERAARASQKPDVDLRNFVVGPADEDGVDPGSPAADGTDSPADSQAENNPTENPQDNGK